MSALRTPGDFERLGRVETFKPASGASRRKHLGVTMADLDRKVFPPLREIVPGVLPEGLTILGGRIKLGKSWMMYDISTAIGYGGYAFGSIAVEQGDVLHLALEDGERWVQTRLRQMLGDTPKPERVELLERFPRLDLGGLDEIEAWAEEAVNPRLVVVDTLVRARRPRGGEDWYCYDYASIEPLKALAGRFRMALVVVHHLNKSQGATDPFDLISGSNGLAACADSTLILDRDGQGVRLYGRGRDVEEFDTALSFDPTRGRWSTLGTADEVRRSDERGVILDTLRGAGGALGPKDIAAAADMKENNVRFLLSKMVAKGEVRRTGRGQYLPPQTSTNNANDANNGEQDEHEC